MDGDLTHRCRWAAQLVGDRRVLHVGPGEIEGAARPDGDPLEAAEFFDAIVWFAELPEPAARALAARAAGGARIVAWLPNGSGGELERAFDLLQRLPGAAVSLQFKAEGSLIVPHGEPEAGSGEVELADRAEAEYAAGFLVTVNVPEEELAADGLAHLVLSPEPVRRLASLERANRELEDANRRLGRQLRALTAGRDPGEPAWEAIRQGATSAGRTLARIEAERAAAQEALLQESRRRYDYEQALEEVSRQLYKQESDAAVAWGRYHELRDRRDVALLLRVAGFFKR